jgi:hypothetical protein
MTEFQPQEPTPSNAAPVPGGEPRPYRDMPDLQGRPYDPFTSYGQQTPTWSAPPAQWPTQAPKRRKAWPWVLGIVGGLVVLGGAGFAVLYGVNGALNADQNENYAGSPIAAGDSPILGDELIISDDGRVAFEMGADWVNAADYVDVSSLTDDLPDNASSMGAYFTADPIIASVTPTMVLVLEGSEPDTLGGVNLERAHESALVGVVDSAKDAGYSPSTDDASPVTTALGLEGLVTVTSMDVDGVPMRIALYTFVRSDRVVFFQIATYTGSDDAATVALVTDSLRIDK